MVVKARSWLKTWSTITKEVSFVCRTTCIVYVCGTHHHPYLYTGLQDMTASVTDCIANLVDAFEGIEPAVLCGSYFDNKDQQTEAYPSHRTSIHRHWVHSNKQMSKLQQHYDKERGVLTLSMQHEKEPLDLIQQDNVMPVVVTSSSSARRQRPHGMMYQKEMMDLHDNDQGPNEQHPMWNFPWKGDDDCIDLDTTSYETSFAHSLLTLSAPAFSASIGHASTTGDFDGDGELDLAISAPYVNDQPKLATGAVYLLNGTRALLTSDRATEDAINNDIRRVAQVMLKGDMDRGRFGWAMATVDLNADGTDDLAVASPFSNRNRGHVDVFYGSTKHGIGSTKPDLRISLPPGSSTEGFGVSLKGLDIDGDGHHDLVVGCPYCTVAGAPHASIFYDYNVALASCSYDTIHRLVPFTCFSAAASSHLLDPLCIRHLTWFSRTRVLSHMKDLEPHLSP